jgi:Cu2+-exporting ATPase
MPDATVCFHCGLPANRTLGYIMQREQDELHFCCPGCMAVAQTILDGGLGKYYDYREGPGTRIAIDQAAPVDHQESAFNKALGGHQQADYSRYDRAEFQREFVQHDGNASTALINIEGISCAACTWLIEHRLQRLDGIEQVHVNLSKHRANIRWRADRTLLSDIFATINSIGYTPSPFSPDGEEQLLEREQREALKRLGVAGIGMMQVGMFAIALHAGQLQGMDELHRDYLRLVSLLVATAVVFYAAQPFFKSAWRSVKNCHLSMDVPVSLAIGLAYSASCWATLNGSGEVYFDSVAMFTFFLLGSRFLEMRARHRSAYVSRGLAALQAPYAWRLSKSSDADPTPPASAEQVPTKHLAVGDTVLIKPGELVPADGEVLGGHSSVDESAFSGEYLPVAKSRGAQVTAGSINADGLLTVAVSATQGQTRLDIITQLLERAQASKPRSAQLADRLASHFVLLVLLCAGATALFWLWWQPAEAFWIALSVLVVSCPCALSLATPTALTAALSSLKTSGVLLSRSDVLEDLPATTTVVFDKTGTLTTGKLQRHRTRVLGSLDSAQCLAIAAALENHSNHPIASAFSTLDGAISNSSLDGTIPRTDDVEILVGQGICGTIAGRRYYIGSPTWIATIVPCEPAPLPASSQPSESSQPSQPSQRPELQIVLASEQQWLAVFELHDAIRPGAQAALSALRRRGLCLRMLSGDGSGAVTHVAQSLGITDYQGGLSPQQKLDQMRQWQEQGERLLMVGDGINDVPVLAAADMSVAVVNATALAKASADCLLLHGDLDGINTILDMATRTRRVIAQNLGWALLYNLTAIPLAACGQIPPWLAALGMSASSLVVVANALRLTKRRPLALASIESH